MTFLVTLALAAQAAEDIDFAELARIADAYDMPGPPKDAPRILAFTETWSVLGNRSTSHDPGRYRPAFFLEKLKDGGARVMTGWEEKEIYAHRDHTPATRPYSLVQPEEKAKSYVLVVGEMRVFVMAVQLARRGELKEAKELWESIRREEYFHDGDALEGVGRLRKDPRLLFARCLYQWLYRDTLRDGADLKSIHERLARLKRDFSVLFVDGFHETRRTCFIDDLGLTVAAEKAPEGSIEALLIAWGNRGGIEPTKDPSARLILLLGPKALRDLKRLESDTRLTRRISAAIMKKPEDRVRLGELARDLIKSIGDAKEVDDKAHHEKGAVELKDGKIAAFNEDSLWVLGQKYPRSLAELCARVPADTEPKTQIFRLAEAVVNSNLPADEKAATLKGLCVRLETDPRIRSALQNLAKVDAKTCAALLRPILARLPKDVDEPYWTCEAAAFGHVVGRLDDEETWADYLKTAKRASVGLRMQMLSPMGAVHLGNRTRRLKFLAAFLDDAEVRDVAAAPKKFEGPHAGFRIDVLSVRDFAAEVLGAVLRVKGDPDELWTAEEWTAYRAQVHEALTKEGIR